VDRKGSAGVLTPAVFGLAALLLTAAAPADKLSRLHPARWLAGEADPVRSLTTTWAECLGPAADVEEAWRVEVGRAAFRTPEVIGGQAARAGLACDSCHQGGRRNAEFYFPHLSGSPGTADVTSAVFSSHRDDGIDNPRPIPDLSAPKPTLKISQDPASADLERFIRGLVTEEFDGAPPPPAVLAGLAAYVRRLSPEACPTPQRIALRVADQVEDARRAVRASQGALMRDDPATAVLMILGARWRLGLIHERYDAPAQAAERAALEAADLDLAAAEAAARAGDPRTGERLSLWLARSLAWGGQLARAEPDSLYAPARIAAVAGSP
jgi:hypothetical protein